MHTEITTGLPTSSLEYLLTLAQNLAVEHEVGGICETLLHEAISLSNADGGTLYLLSSDKRSLDFSLVRNEPLNINDNFFGVDTADTGFASLALFNAAGEHNFQNAACYSFHHQGILNIADIYQEQDLDFSAAKHFDNKNDYHSKSFLCVPLVNKSSEVIGVFQLINAKNQQQELCAFSRLIEQQISILVQFAASALDKQLVIDHQRNLLVELSGEPSTHALIEKILREAKLFTGADGGTLYLVNEEKACLDFSLIINDSLDMDMQAGHEALKGMPSVPLYHPNGLEDFSHVVTAAVHQKRVINIHDVYNDCEFDLTGTRNFDREFHYQSVSFLVVPLLNHDQDVIGVLQLLNAKHPRTDEHIPFCSRSVQLVEAMACYAAIALNNQVLIQELKDLLDAFIQCIAQAIDAKSSHTSAHCQRIPVLTKMIAQAACNDREDFNDFELNSDQWYELNVAAWLHDCGKLATPDSVLDKATKLHLMNDGIEAIKARFAAMRQAVDCRYYQQLIENPKQQAQLTAQQQQAHQQLEDDLTFICTSNKGGEFMQQANKDRIHTIAQQQWPDSNGALQPLLYEAEVANLCIEKGTLSQAERHTINNHMQVTIDMLESLPFPRKLRRVPEYAGGHHEKMDGSGFPKGLTREQMSIPARMMAIADVFEALTSKDRPYKSPMKLSVALNIMSKMVDDHHLDPDIFKLFIRSRVWEHYAKQELLDEQLDITEFPMPL